MTKRNLIVIPVRLESTRLPGKALLKIGGKTILQHTYEQCMESKLADKVLILTPDEAIYDNITSFGGLYRVSLLGNRCGTERLCDSITCTSGEFDKIVSVQVDYPEIDPKLIDRIFNTISDNNLIVSAFYSKRKLKKDDVSCSISISNRLYNFRRDNRESIVHVGIYGFTNKALKLLNLIYQADKSESYDLEQNLWLEYGFSIRGLVTEPTISINNQDDLGLFRSSIT